MQVTAPREPRRAAWWALRTAALLVSAFALAAFSIGWHNPTIRFLGYVALVAMLPIMRALAVHGRRAARAGAGRSGVSEAVNRPSRGTRTVGIGLMLLGLVLFAVGLLGRRWAVAGLGLLATMAGVLLVRTSLDRAAVAAGEGSLGGEVPGGVRGFDRLMRTTGIVLVPLAALSLGSLYLDAAHGYRQGWPLYTFFAVALASALVWPYLFARAYGRWLRR